MAFKVKVGSGFDVHKFDLSKEGENNIKLGGVDVLYKYPLLAHSDGDVLLHALTDAILGSISAGDIGVHFPPTDPQWKNAKSDQFIKFACGLLKEKGGVINNIDVTIICEAPKVSPYRERIIDSLSKILELDKGDISVKATTTEKLGFIGRKEGVACHVVACVALYLE